MKKKLLSIYALIFLIYISYNSVALAKTQGNYVGVDFLHTYMKYETNTNNTYYYGVESADKESVSINYKYLFNIHDVFFGLGTFADHSNLQIRDSSGDPWKLSYRYAGQLMLGYDITNKFAIFATTALTRNKYKIYWPSSKTYRPRANGFGNSVSYGAGIKYSISDRLDINFSYERTGFQLIEPDCTVSSTCNPGKFNLQIFKLGLSFNF